MDGFLLLCVLVHPPPSDSQILEVLTLEVQILEVQILEVQVLEIQDRSGDENMLRAAPGGSERFVRRSCRCDS